MTPLCTQVACSETRLLDEMIAAPSKALALSGQQGPPAAAKWRRGAAPAVSAALCCAGVAAMAAADTMAPSSGGASRPPEIAGADNGLAKDTAAPHREDEGTPKVGTMPGIEEIRAALAATTPTAYEMFAIRVAWCRRVRRATFIRDPTMPERIGIAFAFWLLRGAGRTVLIDSGFAEPKMAKGWHIAGYRHPVDGLAQIHVRPEQVTDIIVTHEHWDHIGGLVHFPSARLWMTPAAFAAGRRWAGKKAPAIATALRAAEQEGRLALVDGMSTAAPGVLLLPVGLHTPGFQAVVVRTPEGPWVFASDIGPLRANFERQRPTGLASDARAARAALLVLTGLVGGKLSRIVPGHEPGGFAANGIMALAERPSFR